MGWRDVIRKSQEVDFMDNMDLLPNVLPLNPLNPEIRSAQNAANDTLLPPELERLIILAAQHYDCSQAEIVKMRELASKEIESAMLAYRSLAREIITAMNEVEQARQAGMVTCAECGNLKARRCMAAREGRIKGVMADYSPVADVFRRCSEYCEKEGG